MSPLLRALPPRILGAALAPALADNVDPVRFPEGMPALTPAESARRLAHLLDHEPDIEWLAARLTASEQALLADLLAYHVLGHRHARVGPPAERLGQLVAQAREELIVAAGVREVAFAGTAATDRFDLRPLGLDLDLESYLLGVQGAFQLRQYRSPDHPRARPRAGDVAIDAGGCFGETALWLADEVGAAGSVVCLEFSPENLEVLRANLAANPGHGERVRVIEAALWSDSARRLAVTRAGPASTVADGRAQADGVPTVALDDLGLARVDFVKMDIEGAEPAALEGARETLARDRPRLALAAYHAIDHLWQLPRALDALGLGYRFGLGHFTMHAEETVLYAWSEA